jgi:hypothetical protein
MDKENLVHVRVAMGRYRTPHGDILVPHEEVGRATLLPIHLDDERCGQGGDRAWRRTPDPALAFGRLQNEAGSA